MHKTKISLLTALFAAGFLLPHSGHCRQNPWEWKAEYWGAETNGLKAGLYIQELSEGTNSGTLRCIPVLLNTRTNAADKVPDRLRLWLPPRESCYQLSLVTTSGQAVPKTPLGKTLGKPMREPLMLTTGPNIRAGYTGQILLVGTPQQVPYSFLLRDCFAIPAPGEYRLTLEMRVIWVTPGWKESLKSTNLPIVALPPVDAPLQVK